MKELQHPKWIGSERRMLKKKSSHFNDGTKQKQKTKTKPYYIQPRSPQIFIFIYLRREKWKKHHRPTDSRPKTYRQTVLLFAAY